MEAPERMRALLRYANYTHVAEGLTLKGYPVSTATVSRWARGQNVTPVAVNLVRDLFAEAHEEAAPPEWAARLADETAMKVIAALVDPEVLAALPDAVAALKAPQPPGVGTPPANGARQARARSRR